MRHELLLLTAYYKDTFMKRLIYLTISLCLLSGCKTSTPEKSILLSGESVAFPEDFLGNTLNLIASDTFYFRSYDPEYKYIVATLRNDTLLTCDSILKVGQGPEEVLDASLFKDRNDRVYALARATNSPLLIKQIDLGSDSRKIADICRGSVTGKIDWSGTNSITFSEDSIVIFAGANISQLKGIFSLFDTRNGEVKNMDFFPEDGIKASPRTKFLIYAMNSTLASNSEGKYLYCLGINKYAFIFHLDNDNVVIDKWLFKNDPDYSQTDELGNFTYHPDKEGLIIYATDKFIYGLLKNLDEYGNIADSFSNLHNGNHIDVFDWDGNKVASYDLDSFGYGIIVDREDRMLYLQKRNVDTDELEILKYTLPEI